MRTPLVHEPARPPRESVIGEVIYAAAWKRLMEQRPRNEYIETTFHAVVDEPNQRRATVAASLITWLGTNCGQAILYAAERHVTENKLLPALAYMLAWTDHNTRRRGINGGSRLLEAVMATDDCYRPAAFGPEIATLARPPVLTLDDYETAEEVIAWLATDEGRAFTREVEREITAARQRRYVATGRVSL